MRIVKAVLVFIIICIVAGVGFLYLAPETTAKLAIGVERWRSGLERNEINLPVFGLIYKFYIISLKNYNDHRNVFCQMPAFCFINEVSVRVLYKNFAVC